LLHAFLSSQAFLFRHIRATIEADLMENCWLNRNGVAENVPARRLPVDNDPQPRHEHATWRAALAA